MEIFVKHFILLAAVSLTGCNWMWVEGSADDVCVSAPMKVQLSQAAIDASLSFSLPHLDVGDQKGFSTSVQLYQAEIDSDRPLSELGSIQKLSLVLDAKDDLPEVTLLDFDDPPAASTQLAVTQQPAEIAKYFVGGKATARLKVKGQLAEGEWAPTVKACAQTMVKYEPGK
ncbi:MAG: hypothetical protein QM723_20625 [Myxococcaceae bacterium]